MGISRSLLGCPSQITDARNYPSRKEKRRRRRIRQDRVWQKKKFCVARRENPFFGDEESNSFCMMVFPPLLQKRDRENKRNRYNQQFLFSKALCRKKILFRSYRRTV